MIKDGVGFGCAITLLLSFCGPALGETNNVPDWFVPPHLVWGRQTNGVQAGVTDGDPSERGVVVYIAQTETNGWWPYIAPPGIKFRKIELRNGEGNLIPIGKHGKEVFGELPLKIEIKNLPHVRIRQKNGRGSGGEIRDQLVGSPVKLGAIIIEDIFHIKNEGDYFLTVCPVIYQSFTNETFVVRVDLPAVTTKIHLNGSAEGD